MATRTSRKIPLLALVLAATLPAAGARACEAIVYWDAGFHGESWVVHGDVPFVGHHWNDQISSIRVISGRWNFYWDANYGGELLSYGPGNYPFVGPHWNDQISSMRCVGEGGGGGGPGPVYVPGGGGRGPGYEIIERERLVRGERDRRGHEHGGHEHEHRGHEGGHHEGGHHGGGGGGHHGGGGGGGGHHGGGGGGGHHGGGGGGGHHGGGRHH